MPTDLLPFSAFVLESSGSPAQDMIDAQTLTLCLADMPLHTGYGEQMSGSLSMTTFGEDDSALRAAVVPVESKPLTLTF